MAARHEDRHSRRLRDTVVRPVLDVGEEDDLALNRREARQGRQEPCAQVGALELADGRIGSLGRDGLVERHEPAATDGPEAVQGLAVDDREQPRGKARWVAAGGELLVGVHEGLLRDVVGLGRVAEEAEGARERGAAVSPHEYRERVLFAREGPGNQLFVGQVGCHITL